MKSLLVFIYLILAIAAGAQEKADSIFVHQPPAVPIFPPIKELAPKAAIGLGYAGAIYLVYQKADRTIQHESQEEKSPFNSRIAHTVSPLGLGSTNVVACGVTTAFALLTKNTRLQKAGFLWAASLGLDDFATTSLKNHFQRYRPSSGKTYNTFDGDDGPKQNRSFPSAHTSTAFTTATILASLYKDKHWVPPFAYGIATMVGLSRIYDNAHWTSDVMAGAAVGFLSAKTVILADKLLASHHIHIYPQIGRKAAGAAMVYQF